jgi:hypothetical protein
MDLMVFPTFSLMISLLNAHSSLMERVMGTTDPQQSLSSSIFDNLEAVYPNSYWFCMYNNKKSISVTIPYFDSDGVKFKHGKHNR